MKLKFTLILSLLFNFLYSQTNNPDYEIINSNNLVVGLHSDGTLYSAENKVDVGLHVNYDQSINLEVGLIFSSSLWLAGITPDGNYRSSQMIYGGTSNGVVYVPGPYNYADIDFDFNKVWKITRFDILDLREDFQDGSIDNELSAEILEWPGSGNPFYNGTLPEQKFAPFYDANVDGIYNPYDGDHPVIDENYPDVIPNQMIYAVYNDNTDLMVDRLQVEIHTLMYSFECTDDLQLNNSFFTKHTVIKQVDDCNDFRVGIWTDNDLGCISDDAVGSIPEMDAFISYNYDPIDGNQNGECQFGISSFEENPGVLGTVFLNQNLDSYSGYFSFTGSLPPGTYKPEFAEEYHNVLNSKWRDGTPITFGGSGYNPGSTDDKNHAFYGNPSDVSEWSYISAEQVAGLYNPIASTGSESLAVGESFVLDLAHVFSQDEQFDNLETIDLSKQAMIDIREYFDNDFEETCGSYVSSEDYKISNTFLYPNPANAVLLIESEIDFNNYEIYDVNGRLVRQANLEGLTIKVIDLTSGMYTLLLKDRDDKIFVTKRFVRM